MPAYSYNAGIGLFAVPQKLDSSSLIKFIGIICGARGTSKLQNNHFKRA
ncbi:hypothetical protein AsAng_0006930 [Aureispira anguillae]|uniref:Uncharacterized protein n=1 Tax=Aureispira anguillae TaxID=2864201 RepID=A0A915YBI7_9BACT|nr:hypothetical protein AsAng_0006930 [Aureispira anguillae]